MFHRARRLVSERVSFVCDAAWTGRVQITPERWLMRECVGCRWSSACWRGEGFPKKRRVLEGWLHILLCKKFGFICIDLTCSVCYRSCGGAAVGQHMLSSSCMNSRLFPMAFALAVWVAEQRNMVFSLLMSRSASCPTLPSTYPLVSVCMCGAQKHSLSHIMTYYYSSHQWRFSDV